MGRRIAAFVIGLILSACPSLPARAPAGDAGSPAMDAGPPPYFPVCSSVPAAAPPDLPSCHITTSTSWPASFEVLAGTQRFEDGVGDAAEFSAPSGVVRNADGTLLVADTGNNRIRRIDMDGTASTLTGSNAAGFADGPPGVARFHAPAGIAQDAAGNLYIADALNHAIRRVDHRGYTTTIAGTGVEGRNDGPACAATFTFPWELALGPDGAIIVVDWVGLRRIERTGQVVTVTEWSSSAPQPHGLAVDSEGTAFLVEADTAILRRIDRGGHDTRPFPSTPLRSFDTRPPPLIAIDSECHPRLSVSDELDGSLVRVEWAGPPTVLTSHLWPYFGNGLLAMDELGNTFISDGTQGGISEVSPAGQVRAVAGRNHWGLMDGAGGVDGKAQLGDARGGIAFDSAGNLIIADRANGLIRRMDPQGTVTTLVPVTWGGFVPAVAVGPDDSIYFLDAEKGLQRLDSFGRQSTLPSSVEVSTPPFERNPILFPHSGIAVDRRSNIFIPRDNGVLRIDPAGNESTLGGPDRIFDRATGIAVGKDGNLYVVDHGHYRVVRIDPQGVVTTLAGNGQYGRADGTGGPDGTARFGEPTFLEMDLDGSILVTDGSDLRRIDAQGNVTTVLHGTTRRYGPCRSGCVLDPSGLALNPAGDIYLYNTPSWDSPGLAGGQIIRVRQPAR